MTDAVPVLPADPNDVVADETPKLHEGLTGVCAVREPQPGIVSVEVTRNISEVE